MQLLSHTRSKPSHIAQSLYWRRDSFPCPEVIIINFSTLKIFGKQVRIRHCAIWLKQDDFNNGLIMIKFFSENVRVRWGFPSIISKGLVRLISTADFYYRSFDLRFLRVFFIISPPFYFRKISFSWIFRVASVSSSSRFSLTPVFEFRL